ATRETEPHHLVMLTPSNLGSEDEARMSGKVVYFFFSSRRRHTSSKRDWSSDVCSSDLVMTRWINGPSGHDGQMSLNRRESWRMEIGRASCRERVETSGGAGAAKRKTIILMIRPNEIKNFDRR